MNRGDLDAELLGWFRKIVEADPAAFAKMTSDPRWEMIAKITDEEIRAVSRALAPANGVSLNFRRYSLQFLDAHLTALNLFSIEFQRLAHGIRGKREVMNQEIDVNWFYFQKTFDTSLSPENYQLIKNNHIASHQFIGRFSRMIVDDIESLLKL